MGIELRPYQRDATSAVERYFETRDGNCILVLPTGAGKSVVQAAFCQNVLQHYPGERLLLLTHVKELVEQNADKLRALWPEAPIGIYSAALERRDTQAPITIATIQSCYRRGHEFGDIALVVIDECQLVPKSGEGMYRRLLSDLRQINPKLKAIGLTATPFRLDSGLLHQGEGAIFTDIAYEARISDLMRDGYLCPLTSKLGSSRADLARVHVRGGEYVAAELERAMDTNALVAGAVDEILALCADRNKWLLFCCGVDHARHVARELQDRGVLTGCVTGELAIPERDQILADFRTGRLRAITNVNVLTTGFDAPDIDAVILLRPTLSAGLYCQMVGRGMRLHPSKTNTLVLDFAGNLLRHGPIDRIRVRGAKEGGGVETAPMRECPNCKGLVLIAARTCEHCGHELAPRQARATHETRAAELPVLCGLEAGLHTVDVDDVTYAVHCKPGRPPSLRVNYRCGLMTYSEWVCLEHDGYARRKALGWWQRRAPTSGAVPDTVLEALRQAPALLRPRQIVVKLDGRYPEILAHKDLEPPNAPPSSGSGPREVALEHAVS